ncbi:MAG: hypothetical protein JW818_08460 [Pirellulales bacterium]|nr:hypothetical protein [Pirellulales bacterium]
MQTNWHFMVAGLNPGQIGALAAMLHGELAQRHGESRRRQAACPTDERLLAWGRRYLPDHFRCGPSAMHAWLGMHLDAMAAMRGAKLNVLGPRGGAKSTIGTLAYPLREALRGREPYIWIVSDTRQQACRHLANIKAELEDNPRLAVDYPDAVGQGPTWRSNAIQLNNGIMIEAYGTGQSIRGQRHGAHRPSLIVCDDLQNDDHIRSPLNRETSRNWFHGALLKAGDPKTNIVNLATALHREALAVELCDTPGWLAKTFQAIRQWPENMSLWHEWESHYCNPSDPKADETARAFYEAHRREMDAGAIVLWPDQEDLYTLMCMRAQSGPTTFEREKQNRPINPADCEWPETYFDDAIWFDDWPTQLQIKTLALDPSKGADARRGDYSALVALGVDRRGILYLEADLARRSTPEIVSQSVEFYRRFRPDAFGVETNQFQELLAGLLADEFIRQGVLGVRPWTIDNRVNKRVRIRRLGPYLAARRVRFKSDSPSTRLLVEQLRQFPAADHDDGPDAAEMALRLAIERLGMEAIDDGLGDRLV